MEIQFELDCLPEDFGFLCMKSAYQNKITGRMTYGGNRLVNIIAKGEEANLQKFIQWIQELIPNSLTINDKPMETVRLISSEFDIFKEPELPIKNRIQKQSL